MDLGPESLGLNICYVLWSGRGTPSLVGEHRPRVLNHVLATVSADGVGVVFLVSIGIAIDLGDVDEALVMTLDEDVRGTRFLEGVFDVGDEVS